MAKFNSKIGLIAATVGSAVGLGNIWRFPAEVHSNGGAAFLMIYIACLFLLGLPVMLAEFSLGRGTHSDAEGAFKKLKPNSKWKITGVLAILASYMILCFYMVVAGWTLEYLYESISGNLFSDMSCANGLERDFQQKMDTFICTPLPPITSTLVLIAANFLILLAGVQKGIERMANVMMPLLFILLIVFAGVSLSLPGASRGLEYFLRPDFTKITTSVIINALGQSFFSLSLGMGILITYSSYFPKNTNLVKTSVTVSLLDLLVAVMMGIIIFPAVASFGLEEGKLQGTTLVFVTLPEIFSQMPCSQLWAILFFLLLLTAALTSTVSVAEVSVAWIQNRFNKSRTKACSIVIIPLVLFSSICSLSFSSLSWIKIAGLSIFDFLDNLATNIFLPTVALLTCIFLGWVVSPRFFKNEITNGNTVARKLFPILNFIIKFIAPPLLLIVLASSLI